MSIADVAKVEIWPPMDLLQWDMCCYCSDAHHDVQRRFEYVVVLESGDDQIQLVVEHRVGCQYDRSPGNEQPGQRERCGA